MLLFIPPCKTLMLNCQNNINWFMHILYHILQTMSSSKSTFATKYFLVFFFFNFTYNSNSHSNLRLKNEPNNWWMNKNMSIFKLLIHKYDKQNVSTTCIIIQNVINYIFLKSIIISTNNIWSRRIDLTIFRIRKLLNILFAYDKRQNIYHTSKQKMHWIYNFHISNVCKHWKQTW